MAIKFVKGKRVVFQIESTERVEWEPGHGFLTRFWSRSGDRLYIYPDKGPRPEPGELVTLRMVRFQAFGTTAESCGIEDINWRVVRKR